MLVGFCLLQIGFYFCFFSFNFYSVKKQSEEEAASFAHGAPSLLDMDIVVPDFLRGRQWAEGDEPNMEEAKMNAGNMHRHTGHVIPAGDIEMDDGIDPNAGPIGPSGPMTGQFNGHFNQGPRPPFQGGRFPGPRGPRFDGPPPGHQQFEEEMGGSGFEGQDFEDSGGYEGSEYEGPGPGSGFDGPGPGPPRPRFDGPRGPRGHWERPPPPHQFHGPRPRFRMPGLRRPGPGNFPHRGPHPRMGGPRGPRGPPPERMNFHGERPPPPAWHESEG